YPGGHRQLKETSEDVVSLLLVGAKKAILEQQRHVTPSLYRSPSGCSLIDPTRRSDNDLSIIGRNELEPFSSTVVVEMRAVALVGRKNIEPIFLLEPWCRYGEGGDPVRLR